MKILFLSTGSGSRGGGETYLRLLANCFATDGHGVRFIIPDIGRSDDLSAALASYGTVQRAPLAPTYDRPLRNVAAVLDTDQKRAIARLVHENAPDIVHVNQQTPEDGLDFLAGAAASGVPCLSTVHITRPARETGARFSWARDAVTRRALRQTPAAFITVSRSSADKLKNFLGTDGSRPLITTVPNGVPAVTEAEIASARRQARRDWGAGETTLVIGCAGRMEAQKSPLSFIKAAASLNVTGLDIKAVWIGDGALRDKVSKAANEAGVSFHCDGWREDARLRLSGFDIFLLPSRFEGMPLAVLEAMHAGRAVIAADTDGVPEVLRQGETGFLCRTETDWREALKRCAESTAERARLGAAARTAARGTFTTDRMAKDTLRVYQAVVQRAAMSS